MKSFHCKISIIRCLRERPSRIQALVPWLAVLRKRAKSGVEGAKDAFEVFSIELPNDRHWYYPSTHPMAGLPMNDVDRKFQNDKRKAEHEDILKMVKDAVD